jgi:hypothetical protein
MLEKVNNVRACNIALLLEEFPSYHPIPKLPVGQHALANGMRFYITVSRCRFPRVHYAALIRRDQRQVNAILQTLNSLSRTAREHLKNNVKDFPN